MVCVVNHEIVEFEEQRFTFVPETAPAKSKLWSKRCRIITGLSMSATFYDDSKIPNLRPLVDDIQEPARPIAIALRYLDDDLYDASKKTMLNRKELIALQREYWRR